MSPDWLFHSTNLFHRDNQAILPVKPTLLNSNQEKVVSCLFCVWRVACDLIVKQVVRKNNRLGQNGLFKK